MHVNRKWVFFIFYNALTPPNLYGKGSLLLQRRFAQTFVPNLRSSVHKVHFRLMCWDRQCAHLSPYLSISTLLYGYLKLLKATRKGKKSKQGFELTPGNRSRDLPHRGGGSLTNCALSLFYVRSFITTFYFRYLIWPMYLLGCSQIMCAH